MCNITPITSDLHLEAQMGKAQAAIETLLFTYADMATDVLMIVKYYADGRASVATMMAAVLAFSLVVQAFFGHVSGQGGWEGVQAGGRRARAVQRRSLPGLSTPAATPAPTPPPYAHRQGHDAGGPARDEARGGDGA